MSKGLKSALIGGGVFLVVFIGFIMYLGSVQVEGNALEQGLSAKYQSSQVELDTYTKKIYESVGIANLQSDQMDRILKDAVSGRYEGKTSAQPGNGQLFSAIVEAYPQLDLSAYNRILEMINQGREAFKQKQNDLRNDIATYQTFLTSGLFRPMIIRTFLGFPTENLEARIGTDVKYGREALERMKLLVTSDRTNTAFETGKDEPLDFNKK